MDFRFSPEEEAFRRELIEFIKAELTPEIQAHSDGPNRWIGATPPSMAFAPYRGFVRKMGERSWLSLSWPKEYGGQERSVMYEYILDETMHWCGAPTSGMGAHVVAPTLLSVGTEDQKKSYLPRISRAEIEFCLGYSEPEAGTDLANIQSRAVRDGDYYIINAQKIFTTAGHYADYCWLMARTDPESRRHHGLTLFIVPMKDPGVSVSAMVTMGSGRTNITHYDNVRVHKSDVVGEENKGWYYMAVALDLERLRIYSWATYLPTLLELVEYCRVTKRGGKALFDDPVVRQKLTGLYVDYQIGRLFTYRTAWMMDKGIVPNYETSIIKVFHSELQQKLAAAAMEIAGYPAVLRAGSPGAQPMLSGDLDLEHFYRACVQPVFAGGTAAVMRSVIATRGMGLPRAF